MKNIILCGLVGGAVLNGTVIAAPGQSPQPGQIVQARVLVDNRSRSEAIPVTLQEIAPDATLRVQVMNPPATGGQNRAVRQPWEYEQIAVGSTNAAALLTTAGADGWETTGLQFPAAGGTIVILKRPR